MHIDRVVLEIGRARLRIIELEDALAAEQAKVIELTPKPIEPAQDKP